MPNLEIDPVKRDALLASFAGSIDEYRQWALSPSTRKFITLAVDFVSPGRSTPAERTSPSEALTKLVRRELVEEFIDVVFRMEDYAGVSGPSGMPDTDYGAEPPGPRNEPGKPAEPARA